MPRSLPAGVPPVHQDRQSESEGTLETGGASCTPTSWDRQSETLEPSPSAWVAKSYGARSGTLVALYCYDGKVYAGGVCAAPASLDPPVIPYGWGKLTSL
jgi:hypothetical protein